MSDPVVQASKFLALILRHKPETIGITLDPQGWANIDEILAKSNGRLTRALLDAAVETNNKARYAISEDGLRIRARQGHSVENVDLQFVPKDPPEFLFHGTHPGALDAIGQEGLKKMSRQHVHLSADLATAKNVGGRRGTPVVFVVSAAFMSGDGYEFYLSENGVWLTDSVPPQYLRLLR